MRGRETPGVVRRALQWCMEAVITSGAAETGCLAEVSDVVPTAPRPATAPVPSAERWVRSETARGLVELERFLDRQQHY